MARRSTRTVRKMKVGEVTLIEKGLFIGGELDDTCCFAQFKDGTKIGGYTSIEDALRHKGEWCEG